MFERNNGNSMHNKMLTDSDNEPIMLCKYTNPTYRIKMDQAGFDEGHVHLAVSCII